MTSTLQFYASNNRELFEAADSLPAFIDALPVDNERRERIREHTKGAGFAREFTMYKTMGVDYGGKYLWTPDATHLADLIEGARLGEGCPDGLDGWAYAGGLFAAHLGGKIAKKEGADYLTHYGAKFMSAHVQPSQMLLDAVEAIWGEDTPFTVDARQRQDGTTLLTVSEQLHGIGTRWLCIIPTECAQVVQFMGDEDRDMITNTELSRIAAKEG